MGFLRKFFGAAKPAPPCEIHPDARDLIRLGDVEWWNSLSLDDCILLEKEDNVFRFAAAQKYHEEDGLTVIDAVKKVRLKFAAYYWNLKTGSKKNSSSMPPMQRFHM